MIMWRDNFFEDPILIEQILNGTFKTVKNPVDDVAYPGINQDISDEVREYVLAEIKGMLGCELRDVTIFARATHKNTPPAPHRIHSDVSMGTHAAHIYLSREFPAGSGTSFWRHKIEGGTHTLDTDVELVVSDMNDLSNWEHEFTLPARHNRILVHEANLWHSAEPYGGFGDSVENGRVVLTIFMTAT